MVINCLSVLYCVLGLGVLILLVIPKYMINTIRMFTLCVVNFIFIWSLLLWAEFAVDTSGFQSIFVCAGFKELNIHLIFGIDGISLFFILLTTLLFPGAVLSVWSLKYPKILLVSLLFIELFLLLSFTVLDLFFFCIFFESLLIPMIFMIFLYGGRERRIKALTYFFMYTLIGSVFLVLALFILYIEIGSTSYIDILVSSLRAELQYVVWGLLFVVFSIKIPMFPFHIWLPEAHVEAPTVGSVLLAGLLLKLGGYGVLRFLFLFDIARHYFEPCVISVCIVSIWVASLTALRQVDLKRIIAYSSISHMNFALLGFFCNNVAGLVGGTLLMVSHGIVSAALFFLIGVLYDRHHTRLIYYYGGLVQIMPLFSGVLFLFIVSNFSFPGTSNFVGELLVILGLAVGKQGLVLIFVALSLFFTLVYSIFLFNRLVYGSLKINAIMRFFDVNRREWAYLMPLLFLNLWMGVIPNGLVITVYFSLVGLTIPEDIEAGFWNASDVFNLNILPLLTYVYDSSIDDLFD